MNAPGGRLRRALPGDVPLLLQWDSFPHVRRAITGAADVDPDHDWPAALRPAAHVAHLIAEVDGRPFAYVEQLDPSRDPVGYWGAQTLPHTRALDIWIGPPDLIGKGLGTQVMRLAIARCFADPTVEAVLVDPRPDNAAAQAFFRSLGFVPTGRYAMHDGCLADVHRLPRRGFTTRR